MNILITGGCGYIGTNLTNSLLDLGHHITVVDIMWFGNYLHPHENLDVIQADIRDIDKIPMDRVIASKLVKMLNVEYSYGETIDGLKIHLDDSSWVLLRSSQTENVLRISAESDTGAKVKSVIREYSERVKILSEE